MPHCGKAFGQLVDVGSTPPLQAIRPGEPGDRSFVWQPLHDPSREIQLFMGRKAPSGQVAVTLSGNGNVSNPRPSKT